MVINNFSKFGWTFPSKSRNAQTIKNSFENIPISSKRKPNSTETDRGKEFCNSIYQKFLKYNNNLNHYSRNSSLGVVSAESFNRTIRDLLKRPVFEKGKASWIDVLPTITKQYNSRVLISTKFTPIQASFKKNEGFVYRDLLDKRNKIKPKPQVSDFVRLAELSKTFSKADTTNWSYNLYKTKKKYF